MTLTSVDSGAGVARTEYRIDGGAWTTYAEPLVFGDAAAALDYRAIDRLGNTESPVQLAIPAVDKRLASVVTATPLAKVVPLGAPGLIRVRVTGAGGKPSGVVTVLAGDRPVAQAKLVYGQAVVNVPTRTLGVGQHRLIVSYPGDTKYKGSTAEVDLTVR